MRLKSPARARGSSIKLSIAAILRRQWSVWIVRTQNRIRLKVDSAGRGLLVMSENYYPGWKATVNGRATRILKVDGGLRGIPVSGGSSTVELRYSPLYMTLGLPVTCLALLFGLAAPFVYRFRLAPRTRRNCEATA